MQFFPDIVPTVANASGKAGGRDARVPGVSALGGVGLKQNGPGQAMAKANAFLEALNQELASLGMAPVVDADAESALPKGFRTIKRDVAATLGNDDITRIVDKLRKRGVEDSALTGIEGLLNNDVAPTIGSIMGVIRGDGRETEDLTDEEMDELSGVFQKLQLTPEESDELMGLMQEGRSFEAMRLLKGKAEALGEGSFGLNAKEAQVLARGLDLSPDAIRKIAMLYSGPAGQTGEDPTRSLAELLGPITEDIATRRAEAEKIAAQFKDVIKEALQEKKTGERNEPVADTRGNGLTGRAEQRMRDDMTAKANAAFGDSIQGPEDEEKQSTVGKPSLPDSSKQGEQPESLLATVKGTLDDDLTGEREDARDDARQEKPNREKFVPVADTTQGKANGTEGQTHSQARQEAAPMLERMDMAPGMTAPTQNQAPVTNQNAAPTFAHRQEIFSQVEQGMLRQLADGNRQMTLQLNPVELGHLTLVLSVKQGEVRALIRAENPEATAALAGQMDQLRATLEEQGLKVAQLDVETQLPDDTTKEQWGESGMEQYNQEREMREQARFARLAKLRAESGTTLAQDMQSKGMREENAASGQPGLHIIA